MNKKLMTILGLGSLSTIGVAGITLGSIALTKTNETNNKLDSLSSKVETNIASINKIISDISTAYGTQSEEIDVQSNEIDSIWETIAANVQNLLTEIQTQGNVFINLYKADLTTELQKVYDALHNHQKLTEENFTIVNTTLSELVQKTNSILSMQQNLTDKVAQIDKESKDSIASLWVAHNSLVTYVNLIESKTTLNSQDVAELNRNVSILQDKVLTIDAITQTLNSVKTDIDSILIRLHDLETRVSGIKDYDDSELKTRIATLELAQAILEQKIKDVDSKANIVDQKFSLLEEKVNVIETKVLLGQNEMTTLKTTVDEIKTLLSDISSVQGQTSAELEGFRQEFQKINQNIGQLFENNITLQKLENDVNYLFQQNLNLFNNFIDLQNQINNIKEENYYRNTVISVESNKVLYSYNDKKFMSQSIEIPNINLAKNIALFIKIQTKGNNSSYVTKIIDAYPEEKNSFLGFAQSTVKENYLLGANIFDNSINVNKMWSKTSAASTWRDMTEDDTSTITLVKAIVTY